MRSETRIRLRTGKFGDLPLPPKFVLAATVQDGTWSLPRHRNRATNRRQFVILVPGCGALGRNFAAENSLSRVAPLSEAIWSAAGIAVTGFTRNSHFLLSRI